MKFGWSDYLGLAQELFEGAANTAYEEASLRSSISRGYYAAFHHARHKLHDKWNISVSQSASAHTQVQTLFKQRGEKSISRKLKWMRAARNDADYDDDFIDLEKDAQNTLKLAKELFKVLEEL
jgi:uncharacterized protein (UPF0332 family)